MEYAKRRASLHRLLGQAHDGAILFLSHGLPARNYPDNHYFPFRQSSHFLYYTGIDEPDFALLSLPDGRDILFGHPFDINVVVWTGLQRSLDEWAEHAQAHETRELSALSDVLQGLKQRPLYLPPVLPDLQLRMAVLLGDSPQQVLEGASLPLVEAVVEQRLKKEPDEVAQIEEALGVTREIFHDLMSLELAEMTESQLFGRVIGAVYARSWAMSFPPILTTHGEVLHAHGYGTTPLEKGRLLLMDMGLETPLGYASDITRTIPVDGVMTTRQKEIYEAVLDGQLSAIEQVGPGKSFRDVHLHAAKVMTGHLCALGLMKGDPEEAVAAGAHALFFPHGLGHMMGVDVHDMEDLGDVVGYSGEGLRSEQFGLGFLRLARELEPGYVVTIEPGLYFIPTLIDLWRAEGRHREFLCYENIEAYRDFGGIRIEDDVLVTRDGGRVLGQPIIKHPEELATWMAGKGAGR